MENKPKQEDILNAILAPREWIENGKYHAKPITVTFYSQASTTFSMSVTSLRPELMSLASEKCSTRS